MVRSLFISAGIFVILSPLAHAATNAGFAIADITPKVEGGRPVFIAGYGQNRKATGVHDPLYVRATVLENNGVKVALASVDVVGLQYPVVERIRSKLSGFAHVLIASTHNHEAPDVVGLWGPSLGKSGVDPEFLDSIVEKTIETITKADASKTPVSAVFGTAADRTLLRDSRKPLVYDDIVRVVKFTSTDTGRAAGLLVAWGCHPEALGDKNTLLTADFPYATIAALEKEHGCPVVYFSGAVGGLMAPPREITDPSSGKKLREESFEYCDVYGKLVADLAKAALDKAEPVKLDPIKIGVRKVAVPLENPTYHLLWFMGALNRDAFAWTGDAAKPGEKLSRNDKKGAKACLKTEVNYLAIGDLHLVGIPGELYPEILFGKYQEPVDPAADFPMAALEKAVVEIVPGPKLFYIGLANDEVGYIIPKRQWDWLPPYTYGAKERHYGEINSVGAETAPILIQALADCVSEAKTPASPSAAGAGN